MPDNPEEGAKIMKAWEAWMGKLGPALVDGGNPVSQAKTIASGGGVSNDGGANPVSGYSIIEAANLDVAIDFAKGCPILGEGGGAIEVCETFNPM
jgi:hypothetical protein